MVKSKTLVLVQAHQRAKPRWFQPDFLPNALGHCGALLHQLHQGGFYDKKNSQGLELNPYLPRA